jgi:DNA-binding NarL/FixJ family response regulator
VTITVVVADDQALVRVGFSGIIAATPGFSVVGEAATGAEAVELARTARPDVVLMDIRMPDMDGIEATRLITGAAQSEAAQSGAAQSGAAQPGAAQSGAAQSGAAQSGGAGTRDVRVLILTTFDLDEYVYAALRAGASGFLLKDTMPADLLQAIRVIAAGDALLAPSVTRRLLGEFSRHGDGSAGPAGAGGAGGLGGASGLGGLGGSAAPAVAGDGGVLRELTEREREVLTLVAQGLSNSEIAAELVISPATAKTHVAHLLTKLGCRDRVQLVIVAYRAGLVPAG